MKYILYIVFVFSIILTGCQYTEGILELKGKALDEKTNAPVPNRKIIVHALVESEDKYIPAYVGEFFTDSLGCFAYTLRKVKTVYLYDFAVVGDTAYAFSNNKIDLAILNQYGQFLSFKLRKLTDLILKIDRKSKTSFHDTLYVSWESDGVNGEILYPYQIVNYGITSNLALRWIGGDVKSVIKTKVYADKKTIVSWELFRKGRPREIIDTIFCKRNVANSLYFNY